MCLFPAAKVALTWRLDNILYVMLPKKAGEQFAIGLLPKASGLLENSHNTLMSWKCALKVFGQKLSGKHVKILSDNTTDVCCINYKGDTKSSSCIDITCDIWSWCIKNSTWLTDADRESRIFNERTEWQLNPDVFSQIRDLWVNPEIDLFATPVNTQLAMFTSWKPDPEATHIVTFKIDWSQYKFYCFPPFPLISRRLWRLPKVLRPRATWAQVWREILNPREVHAKKKNKDGFPFP